MGDIDEFFSRTDSSGSFTPLADGLGSTIALTDSTGTVQTQYTYEPFGNTAATGSANASPYQYTGRENDGTGLYYYRARYYSPIYQRFISEDPLGYRGGINFYAYAGNDPVDFADPLGLKPMHMPGPGMPGNAPGMPNLPPGAPDPWAPPVSPPPGTPPAPGSPNTPGNTPPGHCGSSISCWAKNIAMGAAEGLGLAAAIAQPEIGAAEAGGEAAAAGATAEATSTGTNAFWIGANDGLPAAQAAGANILQLSPEAQAAFDAGNYAPMQAESASWAAGATGENADVYYGTGAGNTFWNYEFPELMNNLNNGSLNQITFHF